MPPRAKRIALTLCGALASACAVLSAGVVPAGASATYQAAAPEGITSVPLAQSDADMQKVVEWWTPDRLKNANSYALRTAASGTSGTSGSAPAMSPAAAGATDHIKTPLGKTSALTGSTPPKTVARLTNSKNVNLPPTVGKVFFRNGDNEYWCSASSVHAKYGNIVATAGHCAFDVKNGKPVQYWIFIPSYTGNGATPYGIYVGHTLHLNEKYAVTGDFDFDYAFVTVHDGYRWEPDLDANRQLKKDAKGQPVYKRVRTGRLEDRVGGQGFAWNRGYTVAAYAFGYPAGPHPNGTRPYTGRTMESCATKATSKIASPKWELNNGVLLKRCAFTAGASGGPWLIAYSPTRRIGYLNGVNSLTWDLDGDGRNDGISSPLFNTATYLVYSYAAREKTT
ncbi:peptidase [Sphaerisporangium siamense]|uniref:V8-like Glu-specific endopeptidase n=1 Tax=Sphaerisporangium siamense TaxID=795645 RepID=A0A7W7G7Z3_9ACTN|nr:serine protease [Sphaerisporangium siamense]MBB4701168.1 V8-like Glu-specific endopeptidase [Sphaerisporangium siamense]GII87465.1 peptidase [Sphaerisporangium siamense]